MALAKVETIYDSNFRDIPKTLRLIAEQIEAGIYGDVSEVALVLAGDRLEVFGIGAADGTTTNYMLGAAQQKLQMALANRGE